MEVVLQVVPDVQAAAARVPINAEVLVRADALDVVRDAEVVVLQAALLPVLQGVETDVVDAAEPVRKVVADLVHKRVDHHVLVIVMDAQAVVQGAQMGVRDVLDAVRIVLLVALRLVNPDVVLVVRDVLDVRNPAGLHVRKLVALLVRDNVMGVLDVHLDAHMDVMDVPGAEVTVRLVVRHLVRLDVDLDVQGVQDVL
jgi:hypothetical protein